MARTHSDSETQREMQPPHGAIEVTIVAHDIGSVGGMERVLAELLTGLVASGHAVTVIARTCELPAGSAVRFHRVRAPGRPFALAYPWFLIAGSLATSPVSSSASTRSMPPTEPMSWAMIVTSIAPWAGCISR